MFVNTDRKLLKNGGRNAIKITQDELKEKIWKLMNKEEPIDYPDVASFDIKQTDRKSVV